MTDIVDRLREFTVHPAAEQSPNFIISLDEAKELLRAYDHMRKLAGAVFDGQSHRDIRVSLRVPSS